VTSRIALKGAAEAAEAAEAEADFFLRVKLKMYSPTTKKKIKGEARARKAMQCC
jgi:hypothetical protein